MILQVAKNLPKLYSGVLWKIEIGSDKIAYLAEKTFTSQVLGGMAWFLLTACGKMQEKRVELKESLRGTRT